MHIGKSLVGAAALLLAGMASTAQAEGLGAEANYGRAEGRWGAELGAGYAMDLMAFRLTPGAGVYIRDGATKLYGRVEGTVALPMLARVGLGARFADDIRPYATIAMPVLPKVAVKGNVGPKYYTIGLTVGY